MPLSLLMAADSGNKTASDRSHLLFRVGVTDLMAAGSQVGSFKTGSSDFVSEAEAAEMALIPFGFTVASLLGHICITIKGAVEGGLAQ